MAGPQVRNQNKPCAPNTKRKTISWRFRQTWRRGVQIAFRWISSRKGNDCPGRWRGDSCHKERALSHLQLVFLNHPTNDCHLPCITPADGDSGVSAVQLLWPPHPHPDGDWAVCRFCGCFAHNPLVLAITLRGRLNPANYQCLRAFVCDLTVTDSAWPRRPHSTVDRMAGRS